MSDHDDPLGVFNFLQEMLPLLPFMLLQRMLLLSFMIHLLLSSYIYMKKHWFVSLDSFFYRVTFKRVIRKKSTEEFSCIPYIIALLNCLLFTWYGLPVVSNKWENFPLVTVNGVGVVLELAYVLIYFWYASKKGKASHSIFSFSSFNSSWLWNQMVN